MVIRFIFIFILLINSVFANECQREEKIRQLSLLEPDLLQWSFDNNHEVHSAVSGGGMLTCKQAKNSGSWYLYRLKCMRAALTPLCQEECAARKRCFYKTYSNNFHCECGVRLAEESVESEHVQIPSENACLGVEQEPNVLDPIAGYLNSTTEHIIKCDEKALAPYRRGFKNKNEFQKELKKQCRKKAKEYKRALLKDLVKEKKFGQAFKALFKRKKYKTKNVNQSGWNSDSVEMPEDFKNMSDEDLQAHIMVFVVLKTTRQNSVTQTQE